MIRQQILNDGRLKWIFIYRWMYRWCDDVCICRCYLFGVWIWFNYLFKILIVFIWIIYQQETSSKLGLLSELIVNKIVLSRDQKYIMYLLCRVYVYQFVNSYRNVLVFVGDLIREVRTAASEDGRLAIACHRRTRARYCRVDHRNWINRYPCNGEQHTLRVVCGKKCRSGQWAERLAALLSQLDDCDCTMGTTTD